MNSLKQHVVAFVLVKRCFASECAEEVVAECVDQQSTVYPQAYTLIGLHMEFMDTRGTRLHLAGPSDAVVFVRKPFWWLETLIKVDRGIRPKDGIAIKKTVFEKCPEQATTLFHAGYGWV